MNMKIAVIFNTPEADRYQAMGEDKTELGVLDEVKAVRQALDRLGHFSLSVPLGPPLEGVKKTLEHLKQLRPDVVFNLFEGFEGIPETEAEVAAMMEELELPFTGCPAGALALALDKARSKAILDEAGISTPGFQILTPENVASFNLPFPCIVKPLSEDASHGISEDSIVADFPALERQVGKISRLFGGRVIVEELVDGREFNTTVMGKKCLEVLAVSEIVYTLPPGKPRILTFESKWEENSIYYQNTQVVCPARITGSEQEQIVRIATEAFRLSGCQGYARVDLRQDSAGRFKILEINPNPDITPGNGAARQAAAAGMEYHQFMQKIIDLAVNE